MLCFCFSFLDQADKESLLAIERSICTLCLDRAMPEESSLSDFHLMTHGGGSQWNSANRWFDKSLQVINLKEMMLTVWLVYSV